MRRVTVDLRERCQRMRCWKIIRSNNVAQANYQRYKPFCSFNCQEWDRLEMAQKYINTIRA